MCVCVCVYAGKKLVACRTAADGFSDIVEKVGGEQEKTRARFVSQTKPHTSILYQCLSLLYCELWI